MDPNPARGSHRLLTVRPRGTTRVAVSGCAIGAVAITIAFIEQATPSVASPSATTTVAPRREPTPIRPAPLVPATVADRAENSAVAQTVEPSEEAVDGGYDTATQAT